MLPRGSEVEVLVSVEGIAQYDEVTILNIHM